VTTDDGPVDPERAEMRSELASIAASLRAYVEWQRDSGTIGFPRRPWKRPVEEQPAEQAPDDPPEDVSVSASATLPLAPQVAVQPPPPPPPPPPQPAPPPPPAPEPALPPPPPPEPRVRLVQLGAEVSTCRKCGLCTKRKRTAFGRGSVGAIVMFVGEAPGQEDDEQGRPFVGRAGQLLDKMVAAMKLTEAEVYIANVMKCRPPDNRRPEPSEIEKCLPHLHEQIELVKPSVLIALGNVAIGALLQTEDGVDKLRGGWRMYRGRTMVMPTYHPSRLLRTDDQQPEIRRKVWEDLQLVMNEVARLKASI
jgi:uracil-DNA glycosylase